MSYVTIRNILKRSIIVSEHCLNLGYYVTVCG